MIEEQIGIKIKIKIKLKLKLEVRIRFLPSYKEKVMTYFDRNSLV